jgi:hypothetical protein
VSDGGWDTERAKFGGVIEVLVEAEQVDICKVTFDGLWELVLVDEVKDEWRKIKWRSCLMVLILHLTSVVKRSIESALTLVPLFLAA